MKKFDKDNNENTKEMWDNAIITRDWFKQLMDSDEDYVDLKKKSKQKKK